MKSSILGKLRLRKGVILLATIALLLVVLLVSNISKFKTIKDVELQDSASVFKEKFRHENTQFPAKQTDQGSYYFHCTPDLTSLNANANFIVGDLTIAAVIPCSYINAKGENDYVFLPALTIDYKRKKSVIGLSNETDDIELDRHANTKEFKKFIAFYYEQFGPIAMLHMSLDKNEVAQSPSYHFFYPLVESYSTKNFEQFIKNGDSSVLHNRILPIYNISKNHTYQ